MKKTLCAAFSALILMALISCVSQNPVEEMPQEDPYLASASTENPSDEVFEELFGPYIGHASGPSIRKVLFHEDDEGMIEEEVLPAEEEPQVVEEIPEEPVPEEELPAEEEEIMEEEPPVAQEGITVLQYEEEEAIVVEDSVVSTEETTENDPSIEEAVKVDEMETVYVGQPEGEASPAPSAYEVQESGSVEIIESPAAQKVETVPEEDWVELAAARHEETWSMTTLDVLRAGRATYWPYISAGALAVVLIILIAVLRRNRRHAGEDTERERYNRQQESRQYDSGEDITASPGVVEGVTAKASSPDRAMAWPEADDEERRLELVSSTRYKVMDELSEYIPVAKKISERYNAMTPEERTAALLRSRELMA